MPLDSLKILFCFHPLPVRWNHGIALLSSLCKSRGIAVDLCLLETKQAFFKVLKENHYNFICFSVTTIREYIRLVPFAKLAKDAGYKTLIGGTWLSLRWPVDEEIFDGVCRGDGETLPDFLLNWDTSLFKSPMIYRDLNMLPLLDYELFEGIPLKRGIPEIDNKFALPYISSRGCPSNKCTFCQAKHQPFYRVRTKVERDLREISEKYKPDIFFMGDALLPYDSKRWRGSWRDFRYPFVAYIRADIKPDLLLWLIDRGMKGCAFGVESGDETYRNTVLKKNLTDDQLWNTIEILEKHSIWYSASFISKTPGERMHHQMKTAQMINKIKGYTFLAPYEELLCPQER